MSKIKHTPGPWEWDWEGVWTKYDPMIYAPWLVQSNSNSRVQVLTGEIYAKNEADARLIAAAPELLEACQMMLVCMGLANWEGDAAAIKARAAIAKATGSQS